MQVRAAIEGTWAYSSSFAWDDTTSVVTQACEITGVILTMANPIPSRGSTGWPYGISCGKMSLPTCSTNVCRFVCRFSAAKYGI